ncbi:MAG: hypothetical protein U0840_13305 [Gemmataceae bacterium]
MIKCPMCREMLPEDARRCRKCQTDLALLADYVTHLRDGLGEAERLTREGELGEAVWAYLSVLEVDPDNTTARRQVGKVATAVRQFDHTAPGRRWLRSIQKEGRWRRWMAGWQERDNTSGWSWIALFLLYFGSVLGAYYLGVHAGKNAPMESSGEPAAQVKEE